MEPEASSRTTSLSGLSLRFLWRSSIGVPPWGMLWWIVRRKSRRPRERWATPCQADPHGTRQPFGQGIGRLDLGGVGHVAKIGLGKALRGGGAFVTAAPGRHSRLVAHTLDTVRFAGGSERITGSGGLARRRPTMTRRTAGA